MRTSGTTWGVGSVLLLLAAGCAPAPPAEPTVFDSAAFRQHVEQMNTSFMQAVRQRDAATIAEFYAQDARLLASNQPMIEGRQAIQQYWESLFQVGLQDVSTEMVDVGGSGTIAYEIGVYRLTAQDPGTAAQPAPPGQPTTPGQQVPPGQPGQPGQPMAPSQPRLTPGTDDGKYVIVWRHQNGTDSPGNLDPAGEQAQTGEMQWRIAVQAFNSDRPAPGLEAAPQAPLRP